MIKVARLLSSGAVGRIQHALCCLELNNRAAWRCSGICRARAVYGAAATTSPKFRTRSPRLAIERCGQIERRHRSGQPAVLHGNTHWPASRSHRRALPLGSSAAALGRSSGCALRRRYEQGRYTAHSIAKAYTKPDAYRFGTTREDLSRDWAIVELAEPMTLKPLGLSRAIGADTGVTTITGIVRAGYKSYISQTVSVERGCQARYEPSAFPLLDHYCRVVAGESGSALVLRDSEPGVVGILVASSLDGSALSIAVPASSFRAAVEVALKGEAPGSGSGSNSVKPATVSPRR